MQNRQIDIFSADDRQTALGRKKAKEITIEKLLEITAVVTQAKQMSFFLQSLFK